jgi:hypothetical protein
MAEEKKDDKKGDKKDGEGKKIEIISELLIIVIVFYLIGRLFGFFHFGSNAGVSSSAGFSFKSFFDRAGLTSLFDSLASTYIFFASILSTLFIMGIVYSLLRLSVLEKTWKDILNPAQPDGVVEKPKNTRWQRVVVHISSDNASDWRLAILECDIILDELLDKLGYIGGTIGDKLKNADTAHFSTLNQAWEAHKIRNAIAHEGQDFTLTQREARRIVGLYETVFREFDFI